MQSSILTYFVLICACFFIPTEVDGGAGAIAPAPVTVDVAANGLLSVCVDVSLPASIEVCLNNAGLNLQVFTSLNVLYGVLADIYVGVSFNNLSWASFVLCCSRYNLLNVNVNLKVGQLAFLRALAAVKL